MRRRSDTTRLAALLISAACVCVVTPLHAAEWWAPWRKSALTADSQSAKPPAANKPATRSTATKPTPQNLRQAAPVSASATPAPPAKPWWNLSRYTSQASTKPAPLSAKPPVKTADPIVVHKAPASKVTREVPKAVTSRPPSSPPPAVEDELDPRYRTIVTLDHPEFVEVEEPRVQLERKPAPQLPHTEHVTAEVLTRPPFRQPTWQRAKGSIRPVVYDGEETDAAFPPPPAIKAPTGISTTQLLLPPAGPEQTPTIQLRPSEAGDERISLTVRDAPLSVVLSLIAEQQGLNLVAGGEVEGRVTVTLNDVGLDDALNALLTVNGYSWNRNRNILIVSRIANDNNTSPQLRGVMLRVFRLNYVSADDIDKVVQSLLSPAGHAVTTIIDAKNSRRTREEIVVEDLPEYLARVEAYIAAVDRPPRQVLIEAHVLQINLKDDCRHGVNLQEIFDIGSTKITLSTTGFANPKASPAFFFGIDNANFHSLLEALKVSTDSKTLATPQVLCLNGQHARIQIGQQLGFLVTTTTQTSTLQNVNFLDVGVVLDVTPTITDEGLVMMQVKPEVSGGQINAAGLPQEDTTEVETTVMLADGCGMIIGGLIKEEDTEVQTKVPYLGDLWLVGRLFQKRTVLRQRNEVIIALVPYIMPYPEDKPPEMEIGLERARTPLLTPPLERNDRRQWEPDNYDAIRNPRKLFSGEIKQRIIDPYATSRPVYILNEEPPYAEEMPTLNDVTAP